MGVRTTGFITCKVLRTVLTTVSYSLTKSWGISKSKGEAETTQISALGWPRVPGKPRLTHGNFQLLSSMGNSNCKGFEGCLPGRGARWETFLPTNLQWRYEASWKISGAGESTEPLKAWIKSTEVMKDSQGRWKRNVTMAAGFLKLDQEFWYAFRKPLFSVFSQDVNYESDRYVFPFGE